MKIMITGADGQLGRCLQDRLRESDHQWVAYNRLELDITDAASVDEIPGARGLPWSGKTEGEVV